jgi:1-acyl-sn-glycerol-3-phosphate acyltransferase
MIGWIRTILALLVVAVVTLALAPFQYSALKFGVPRPGLVPRLWHRVALKALGIQVRVKGDISAERPLFVVANHISWLDIMVVGSVAEVSFISKSELAGWPGIGWLARMQRSIFIEREKKRRSGEQANEIGRRLVAGDVMVLFAEGTTSDGNVVLPFKSTLFGAAKMALDHEAVERVVVQPMAVAYTRLHGLPMNRMHRPLVSWIGDADLVPQIRALLKEGAVDVEIRFGEAFDFTRSTNRKGVSGQAEKQVRDMHTDALRNPA